MGDFTILAGMAVLIRLPVMPAGTLGMSVLLLAERGVPEPRNNDTLALTTALRYHMQQPHTVQFGLPRGPEHICVDVGRCCRQIVSELIDLLQSSHQ